MTIAERELLLQGLIKFLDPEQIAETPMNNDNGIHESHADTTAPEPKQYIFSRGDYKPGETKPLPELHNPDEEIVHEVKEVKQPEDSYVVAPDKVTDFGTLMNEGNADKSQGWSWEDMTPVQRAISIASGVAVAILVFLIMVFGGNILSGGHQYAPRPTTVAQVPSVAPPLGAGALVPTEAPTQAATSAPAPTSASVTGCNGIQFYHSPDVKDVGPCVPEDEPVVPTGVYGKDGVWLFMILKDGSTKWVKAESYGYSPEQVKAMNLKDYAALPPPPTQAPITNNGGNNGGGWQPSDGLPPAASATPEPPAPSPTPVLPTVTPGCDAGGHCTKEPKEPQPTSKPHPGVDFMQG